jgi:lipopolysaccharide export system protein LptA
MKKICIIFLLLLPTLAVSQTQPPSKSKPKPIVAKPDTTKPRVVLLERANEIVGTKIDTEQVRLAIGNVRFVEATTTVDCDTAVDYQASKKIRVAGHVVIVRDTVTLRGKEGFYFTQERRSVMKDSVSLTDDKVLLKSQEGTYFSDERKAIFRINVSLKDSDNTVFSDSLVYFRDLEKSIAIGRVRIVNTADNAVIYGGYAESYGKTDYSFIEQKPELVKIDTSTSGSKPVIDTLIIRSLKMESFRDTTNDKAVMTDSVRILRSELRAKCRKAIYFFKTKRISLNGNPIVWYGDTQVTGDSIVVQLRPAKPATPNATTSNNTIDKIFVYRNAFLASKDSADSAGKKFNQLSGKTLIITFDDSSHIQRADVYQQATSLYYTYDNQDPNGANVASGDVITIMFRNNQVKSVTVKGGVEGVYYPEKLAIKQSLNLAGFHWRPKEKPEK